MRMCDGTLILRAIIVLSCSAWAGAVSMHMPVTGTKCVSEEIQANVVVLTDYSAAYEDDQQESTASVSCKVTSPYGNTLHHQKNITKGQFAFTTNESGNYLVCFSLDSEKRDVVASVSVNWRIGIAAKDWDSIAKKEKIEGIELELRKLEGAVEAIHENLLYLKSRYLKWKWR
ncbi:transmembrane emp24 domain-containing protein p24delta3-like isoform X2 [Asparagus officinalis]|uniref:transmembrane emp24 domain-containing protein p24delta3-like isoform X2 n=1 Tax=Asparagus officinalis TaxID=4686 RepID=UPI00098E3EE1|nr:transmembrane emp24 domain-containing protein p24delta3-like isoform X2 [Asparagus officinalis]